MRRFLVALALLGIALPQYSWAVSKIYSAPESAITFADSAQTPSATITLSALASAAGRISARYDRGAGSHAGLYRWRCTLQATSTVTVGTVAEIYLSSSDGTNPDGQIGTADATLTADKRRNLIPLGVVVADQTASNTNMTGSGTVFVPERYVSIGIWNGYDVALRTSTSVHMCSLTPMPFEMQ